MPRSVPKIAIFEEAAGTLDIPGGTKRIQEYYRQMRKFGCNILAVVQQYDIIKDSVVRGGIIGNSKMLSTVKFGQPTEANKESVVPPGQRFPPTRASEIPQKYRIKFLSWKKVPAFGPHLVSFSDSPA
jgi:hypothetical protein